MNRTKSTVKLKRRVKSDLVSVEDVAARAALRVLTRVRLLALNSLRTHVKFSAKALIMNELVPVLAKASAISDAMGRRRSRLMVRQQKGLMLDAYSEMLKIVRKTLDVKIDLLQQQYGDTVGDMLEKYADDIDGKILQKVGELIKDGVPTRNAVDELEEALDSWGVTGVSGTKLEIVFRTQLQASYSAGRWKEDQDPDIQEILWGYKYVTAGDDRVRYSHAAWDGTTLPKEHMFWQTHWPPNGWNCRCQVIPIFDEREEVEPTTYFAPDDGFTGNPADLFPLSRPSIFKLSFDPDQPRVPAGEAGGGQWAGNGPTGRLTKVKNLGGSTGAQLVHDESGKKWVKKKDGGPGQTKSEIAVNRMYKAAGVDGIPDSHEVGPGEIVNSFVEGEQLGNLYGADKMNAVTKLKEHFVADAMFANWDVVGLSEDNVLVDSKGGVHRIDNGGALEYRAQGKLKGDAWNGKVSELDSMRQHIGIYKDITEVDIKEQGHKLLAKKDAILKATPAKLKAVMKERFDTLEKRIGPKPEPSVKSDGKHGIFGRGHEAKVELLKSKVTDVKMTKGDYDKLAGLNDGTDNSKIFVPYKFSDEQNTAIQKAFPGKEIKKINANKTLKDKGVKDKLAKSQAEPASEKKMWPSPVTKSEKADAIKLAKTPQQKVEAAQLKTHDGKEQIGYKVTSDRPEVKSGGVMHHIDSKGTNNKERTGQWNAIKTQVDPEGKYKKYEYIPNDKMKEVLGKGYDRVSDWKGSADAYRDLEAGRDLVNGKSLPDYQKSPEMHAALKDFHATLDKCPKYEGITYRGVGHLGPGSEYHAAITTIGSTVELECSACSSMNTSTAAYFASKGKFSQAVMIRFKGRSGADISKIHDHHDEAEVVQRKGTKFRVTGVAHDVTIGYKKVTLIDMDEIHPDEEAQYKYALSREAEGDEPEGIDGVPHKERRPGDSFERWVEQNPFDTMTVRWPPDEFEQT